MRGRPPKPTEKKRREGNAGKRKLPTRAQTSRVAPPTTDTDWTPPEALGADGRAEWEYIVPRLLAARWLDEADRLALTIMCEWWDVAEAARRVIADEGVLTMGSRKQWVENPALATLHKATVMILRYAEQFGMTASARARLDLAKGGLADPAGELERQIGASPRLRVMK